MVMPRAVQLRRPARPTKRHRMRSKSNNLDYTVAKAKSYRSLNPRR